MKEWRPEMLAVSRAGHDKDTLYLVLGCEGGYLWLADGKKRLLETPKKKKRRHVQEIRHLPDEMLGRMRSVTLDAHVRKLLADYRRMQENKQQF